MKHLPGKSYLRKLSAGDRSYYETKQKILEGVLAPGQPIVEEDLASELEISRTPLRSGLQQLEFENLVVRKSNGRLIVAPVSIQEVKEVFKVRGRLEEIAVEEATDNATEEDIKNLSNIVYMIKRANKSGEIDDILYYGSQFHNYIYDLSGNQTVSNILAQLNDHIHRYRRLVPKKHMEKLNVEEDEHEVILEYMTKKDKKGAQQAIRRHIQNSLETAVGAIKLLEDEKMEEVK